MNLMKAPPIWIFFLSFCLSGGSLGDLRLLNSDGWGVVSSVVVGVISTTEIGAAALLSEAISFFYLFYY